MRLHETEPNGCHRRQLGDSGPPAVIRAESHEAPVVSLPPHDEAPTSGTTKDPGPWEGELRNMWKPTRQPGLWFHGGNLHQSRHYSQFLSLQIKARMAAIPTPVYGMGKAHRVN